MKQQTKTFNSNIKKDKQILHRNKIDMSDFFLIDKKKVKYGGKKMIVEIK